MKPLRLVETQPGAFSLLLNEGETSVDELIEDLGHTANGYFWTGVARWLVTYEAPALEGRFDYDPEAGMFCAYGDDHVALESSTPDICAPSPEARSHFVQSTTASPLNTLKCFALVVTSVRS